ncbi:hypothetical protein [Paenibacillus cremeus]|uniref:MarR family transcriptional regulator n=1 Tax=Paenibacillus cremeus TaxID=2163881 RepID=A0A559K3B7_9BACL|nr:hypothetical protein [Paenibacillus cremeus]TVY06570.1 hypothetical protein FPZ49_28655 [Paenibacillus cremeus]
MLPDIERKMLRIIANYSALRNYTPTIEDLENKTGRDRQGVLQVLAVLTQEQYIQWSKNEPGYIQLLVAWERTPLRPVTTPIFDSRYSAFMS